MHETVPHIVWELSVATVMVMLTVVIHGGGLAFLSRLLRLEARDEAAHHIHPMSGRSLAATVALVLALFMLHGGEIWLYAGLFWALEAVPVFEDAIYFSTITYAAIGYDDDAMSHGWRLVAAIEGINGVLLLGWSTAFFITVVARLGRR